MSAFVDLCFGDFTEEETQDFLCENFSAVLASTLKISCKEFSQSPDASHSDKDAASLSNHTEGEPTSPEEVLSVLKLTKKKIKKKTRKRRKSNTHLSESSSSDEFTPSLGVEFDVKSSEIKDNDSEERQDASPSSSPVEETINDDGSVSKVPSCVQQHPWSNLNKKPRSSSSTSASSHEEQTRRKPTSRQVAHKVHDSEKKWNGENLSDGDISGSSGTNIATTFDKKEDGKACDFSEKITNKSDETLNAKCSQINEVPNEELVTEIKQPPSTAESMNDPLPCKKDAVVVQPSAPKRWADLFSKPSSTKQKASGLNGDGVKIKSADNQVACASTVDQQQRRPVKPNDYRRSDSRQGGDRVSDNAGAQQPVPGASQNRGSGQGKRQGHLPSKAGQNQHSYSGQHLSYSTSSNTTSRASKTNEEKSTENLGTTSQKPHQNERKEKQFENHTSEQVRVTSSIGEPKSGGLQENSDMSSKRGNDYNKNNKKIAQNKSREQVVNQPTITPPQTQLITENNTQTRKTNQKRNVKSVEVNAAVKNEGKDVTEINKGEDESQEKSSSKKVKEMDGIIFTAAETTDDGDDCQKNKLSNTVNHAGEDKDHCVNEQEDNGNLVNNVSAKQPLESLSEITEKEKASLDAATTSADNKEEIDNQKNAEVVEPVKQIPWQSSKRWSDLFNKPKLQEGENNTKKQTDFKNVNGDEKTDRELRKRRMQQKCLSLEEEEKFQLALEVAEIIQNCKLRTSGGDIPQPRGFINTSNWCYVNSTLQALIACPQLVMCLRALIPVVDRLKTVAPYSGAIVDLLKEFQYLEGDVTTQRKRVIHPLETKGPPFEPHGVYKALEQLNNHLTKAKDHHQHDAEEYLTTSLGRIDHELMELLKIANQPSENGDEDDNEELDSEGAWQEVYKKNKSTVIRRINANDTPITQIFGGDFRSYVFRNNKLDSSMIEPFLTLSLSVDGGVMTVEEALRKDLGKEDVIGDEGSVIKKLLFERLPKVMIIQLKKFSYDSSNGCVKLKKNLAFHDELVIEKDLISTTSQYAADKDRSYRLSAVLYHAGRNAHCGHYVTAAKYIQQWLLFDDNFIKPIALKRVLQPEAREPYILFYTRN